MADPNANPYADPTLWKKLAQAGAGMTMSPAASKYLERGAAEMRARRGILQSSQQYATVDPTKLAMAPSVSQSRIDANDAAYKGLNQNNISGQAQQQDMVNYLRMRANGLGGPSASQQQFMQQTADGVQNMRAVAATNRLNPAAAARQANAGIERVGLEGQQQMNLLGLQDQQAAQIALGNQLQQMRAQDNQAAQQAADRAAGYQDAAFQGSQFMAQQQMQRNLANAEADDAARGRQQDIYTQYMNQIQTAKKNREAQGFGIAGAIGQAVGSLVGI